MKPICHKNGKLTYFSVLRQEKREETEWLPYKELIAMSDDDRRRVLVHLQLNEWISTDRGYRKTE